MPKNLVVALSAGALALGVAACGGSSSSSSSAAAPATSSTAAAAPGAYAAAGTSTAASAPSSGASSHVAIAANPSGALMFDKSSLAVKAGKVTVTFTNTSPEGHNFTIESPSGAKVGATPTFNGGSRTLTVSLKRGTYTFLCTVPGHAMAGMKGTLTVT